MENAFQSTDCSGVSIPTIQASSRFTLYTVGLLGFILFFALLDRHVPQQKPLPSSTGVQLAVLIFQWVLFYMAYRGIRASGMSFRDAAGQGWSSITEFWKDLKLALIVVLLIYLATYFLVHLSPFHPFPIRHARTGFQFFMTLLVAGSAGFTEEVIFRGLFFSQFYLLIRNKIAAAVIQAVVFSMAHGGNQSVTQFLKHCFSGCLFAYLAISRKSLWPSILAHVLLDISAFTVQFLMKSPSH